MAEVTVLSLRNQQQQIIAAPHSYISDEPPEFDGDDLGGTPYEYLLGALGSCTNMTLMVYAGRKGWDLQAVETYLSYDRTYGRDCASCEDEEAFMDVIRRRITLHGDLAGEQVERLRYIATRCPLHKTLRRTVDVRDVVEAQ
jgi:putative redox protein